MGSCGASGGYRPDYAPIRCDYYWSDTTCSVPPRLSVGLVKRDALNRPVVGSPRAGKGSRLGLFPSLMSLSPLESLDVDAAFCLSSTRGPAACTVDTTCGLVLRLRGLPGRGAQGARARFACGALGISRALGRFTTLGSFFLASHGLT
jgi:hypothetical protein